MIVSRAGANAICELLALRKPNILIPLSAAASRGDQILNAASFEEQHFSTVIKEENLTDDALYQAIQDTYRDRTRFIQTMKQSPLGNAVETVVNLIEEYAVR